MAIVPVCIANTYCIYSSPYCDLSNVSFDPDARRVWRTDQYRLPFSRQYSPKAFVDRLWKNIPASMQGKLLYIANLDELIARYKGQRIYGAFMFCCEKRAPTS